MREIRASIHIAARPQRVWRAVESQEAMRKWLAGSMEYEPRLGGRVRIFGGDDKGTKYVFEGTVTIWEPGRRLAFTWEGIAPDPHPPTLLSLELEPEGEGTLVTLVHSGFDTDESWKSYQQGWGDMHRSLRKIEQLALEEMPA